MFLREIIFCQQHIDYLIETSITVNWIVGTDKGMYT